MVMVAEMLLNWRDRGPAADHSAASARIARAGDPMSERRSERRRRTLFDGRLAINHLSTFDCVVRNMSARGARLVCRITPPIEFVRLEIRAVPGFKRKARVVWRRLEDCGVEFL
jgi:hypothetical protein